MPHTSRVIIMVLVLHCYMLARRVCYHTAKMKFKIEGWLPASAHYHFVILLSIVVTKSAMIIAPGKVHKGMSKKSSRLVSEFFLPGRYYLNRLMGCSVRGCGSCQTFKVVCKASNEREEGNVSAAGAGQVLR